MPSSIDSTPLHQTRRERLQQHHKSTGEARQVSSRGQRVRRAAGAVHRAVRPPHRHQVHQAAPADARGGRGQADRPGTNRDLSLSVKLTFGYNENRIK